MHAWGLWCGLDVHGWETDAARVLEVAGRHGEVSWLVEKGCCNVLVAATDKAPMRAVEGWWMGG